MMDSMNMEWSGVSGIKAIKKIILYGLNMWKIALRKDMPEIRHMWKNSKKHQ